MSCAGVCVDTSVCVNEVQPTERQERIHEPQEVRQCVSTRVVWCNKVQQVSVPVLDINVLLLTHKKSVKNFKRLQKNQWSRKYTFILPQTQCFYW